MAKPAISARLIIFFIGCVFVCFAIGVASSNYADFLLGENHKDLNFGPLLFRILLLFHGILLVAVALFAKIAFVEKKTKNEISRRNRLASSALIILCLLAFGLRLINLNADLWVDEVYTLLDFVRPPLGEIVTSFPSQNQHLLYSILAHAAIFVFGESAWAVRLPAVLFGAASIPALFLLARKLLGTKTALMAALLMTVSYHHIWFSQNARGYTGLLFFTILATWLWFEALEKNLWSWWLVYSAAVVGGMWVHLTMAFVVVSHAIVYLILLIWPQLSCEQNDFLPERRAGGKPLAAWFLSATVTAQLYALALPEFLRAGLHEESRNSEWTNPLWVVAEILANLQIGFAGIPLVMAGAAFVIFGWASLFKKNRRAAILMILPPLFAGCSMLALAHNLFPRFFFFAMGFGLIIVIHGALELPQALSKHASILPKIQNPKSKIQNPLGLTFALLIVAASIVTVPRNYRLPKQDFSGALNFLEANRQPTDEIVAVSMAGDVYCRYFVRRWPIVKTDSQLARIEQKSEKIWLVYTLAPEIKAFRPELWQLIERDYETIKIFPGTLNGGEIFVCHSLRKIEESYETSQNDENSQSNSIERQTALVKQR